RDDLVEGRLAVPGAAGRRAGEGDVLVERRVLVARGGLDRGDDLARDAQLGEVAEARLAVGPVVADRLVEADEPLLDEVVRVSPGQEVRRGFEAHEPVVPANDVVISLAVPLLGESDEITILDLRLRAGSCRKSSHGASLLEQTDEGRSVGIRGAVPPLAPH